MRTCTRAAALSILMLTTLSLAGCTGRVGIGVGVGVPIGNHGYVNVGTGRWL